MHSQQVDSGDSHHPAERHAERLAQALREVIGSHYCGQVTCSIALSRLHDYEREVEGRRSGEVTRAPVR